MSSTNVFEELCFCTYSWRSMFLYLFSQNGAQLCRISSVLHLCTMARDCLKMTHWSATRKAWMKKTWQFSLCDLLCNCCFEVDGGKAQGNRIMSTWQTLYDLCQYNTVSESCLSMKEEYSKNHLRWKSSPQRDLELISQLLSISPSFPLFLLKMRMQGRNCSAQKYSDVLGLWALWFGLWALEPCSLDWDLHSTLCKLQHLQQVSLCLYPSTFWFLNGNDFKTQCCLKNESVNIS